MDLFSQKPDAFPSGHQPLAYRMRPRTLEEFVGQKHLLGPERPIRRMIEEKRPFSFILWGPPGSGKTALAHLVANAIGAEFVQGNAVLWGVKEIRDTVLEAQRRLKGCLKRTVLFIDEIHRFNRPQQEALLLGVEDGSVVLIGATTQNPSFGIIGSLLSRLRVFELKPLTEEELLEVLKRALYDKDRGLGREEVEVSDEVLRVIARLSAGDARTALNVLELAVFLAPREGQKKVLGMKEVLEASQTRFPYDRQGDDRYELISAFQKSIRGSDPDAAIYWLVRMLEGGEDPLYIARRLIVTAAEDVGLADPMGIVVAVAALLAFQQLGQPEGELALAEATLYLATAPKSNSALMALERARKELKEKGPLEVPLHLRKASTTLMRQWGYGKGYLYPHDYPGGFVEQDYLPKGVKGGYYFPSGRGYEKTIEERLLKWWKGKRGG